ncbi:metallophosphoesterase [Devosia sp. MC521]|uniref:metallophosphoesterase n=1 Tax=Devosia sp. MC521 TaxID=2759954 RepID=UPI0015F98B36|nr:metallophosphoesterase [Devosia sp. MC521]MBJ6986063.1 metallophosphoesterase [Devosia sp. MC521]QMW61433.1 metallophosphoesterase [Devosia sp. MC521]
MKLWIVSDLHMDSTYWVPDRIPAHDVMIIAGDVDGSAAETEQTLLLIARWAPTPIIFVPGNHDVMGGDMDAWDRGNEDLLDRGIHVLSSGQSIVIDDVRFVGGTLWTDWQLGDREWQSQAWAARHMREYQSVSRPGDGPLWPVHTSDAHDMHLAAIEGVLSRRHEGPSVVVTHHAPSPLSLRPGEERGVEAAAYASDLEETMMIWGPDLWVHGHTHHACDYHVGATRVVSNPRGYVRDDWCEKTGWNEDLTIEV